MDAADLPAALRTTIEADAKEAEMQGNMTTRVCTALREAGAFRLLTPHEFGGREIPLTTALTVYERFGRIDASIGALVWNLNMGFVAALLPDSGARRIFDGTREPILANSGAPGTAERVDGGYRLSGRWPIVSGVDFADWVLLVVMITENGQPVVGKAGLPQPWFAMVHREQFTIDFTWDVTAMRATGSNSVVVENAFIAEDLAAPLEGRPVIDRALYRDYLPSIVFPGCSAVLLGVTAAAVDELVEVIASRKAAGNHRVQYLVAKSEAQLSAARLLLHDTAGSLQESAEAELAVTTTQRVQLRAAMSNVADVCTEILVTAYRLAGSAALYRSHRIEGLCRDGMALAQHALQSAQYLELAGRVRLGLDPELPMY
ncbi:acyl-CoA dehydrogenase family protein [Mycobacterium sp. 236(2023)]|uniref:acyl-CoA dehydrogenase family protein n=1 Tax=Mycobacterium sp. 236(2023) TaxID=3038163 RepID=UPI0024153449|nr:acyl-CoA dehydrogenase family protein [Mycobacterium sp. 236(2023)]MDG4665605.1 acyl-CoA dehydrogenase family protein [Mycobacterium sp. 236(2023)]